MGVHHLVKNKYTNFEDTAWSLVMYSYVLFN